MELTSNIKRIILKFSFLSLTFCVLLWFSIFSYGLLYYLYIPSIAHTKSVHLRYDSRCTKNKICSFPYDNITLVEKDHHELLSGGQAYAVELALDMPESEHNLNQGVFMIHLDMLSLSGEVLKSTRRPALLRYRSPLFKIIYTLFFVPALLAGTVEEKQSLTVPLFEKYVENCNEPTYYTFIEIESTAVEVYSCSLRIHAQFTGLRYMMYYWPTFSALIGVGTNFFFLSIIVIFIWIRQIVNTSQLIDLSALSESEQELVNEIRQSVQRSQSQKSLDSCYEEADNSTEDPVGSDNENSQVEDISPHEGFPRSRPRWYPENMPFPTVLSSKSTESSIRRSEPSTLRQAELSEETDNILNLCQASEESTSPTPVDSTLHYRKRAILE